MISTDDAVTFVVPGDLHLTEAGLENHRVAIKVTDEVNDLIRPDFVQFIGDNVQDADEVQFRIFDELRSRLQVPHFALVGDHDVKDDPGAEGFRSHVGPTFGSTSLRGFRFLRLDTQQARPLGISSRQVEWLRGEVDDAIAKGERPLIFQHNYPFQIWENYDGPGIDEWRGIVQSRRVVGIVCGHTHYWQVANDGRNAFVAVRSIGDPEGGPPGYLVGQVGGDDFAVIYRTVEDRGPLALITHPREAILATGPAHVVSGRDRFEVRVWSHSKVRTVQGRLDEGDGFDLEPSDPGRWTAPLPGDRLSKGRHRFETRVRDHEGLEAGHAIDFLVDPTGSHTAVPTAAPVVDRTDFC
jgi:3',5'-cyclic-AMP phosphodiesterase